MALKHSEENHNIILFGDAGTPLARKDTALMFPQEGKGTGFTNTKSKRIFMKSPLNAVNVLKNRLTHHLQLDCLHPHNCVNVRNNANRIKVMKMSKLQCKTPIRRDVNI